ncbi:MAG: metallophosphoesterase [Candidatus Paceibacterota bacterium]|jgi:hypothetical protein
MKLKIKKKWIVAVVISAFMMVFGYSYFIEPNMIVAESLDLDLDCSNTLGASVRFVQISDLHFNKDTVDGKISDIYSSIKSQKPDSVFITGDLITDKSGIEKAIDLVRMISNEYPTYIVFGNWDYWSLDFDMRDFTTKLEKAGAKVITNSNDGFALNGNNFYILGVKDPYTSGENADDMEKAFNGIDNSVKSCKILLAHSPNVIKYAKNKGIDLILVGHTHGGQIYIPFLSEQFIPARREAGKGFISGLYKIDNDRMYVNRGIGMSTVPLRFLVPPEITVITIN